MANYSWNTAAGGAWATTTNWTPTAPVGGPGNTDTATFSQNITANATITLPATITAQTISAQDTVNSHPWFIGQTGVSNSWAPGVNAVFTVPILETVSTYSLYFYARLTGSVDFKKTGLGTVGLALPNAGAHNPTSITMQDGRIFFVNNAIASTTTINIGESGNPPSGIIGFDSGSSITSTQSSSIVINQNATLQGASVSTGTLSLTGTVNFGSNQRTITVTNGPVTMSGVLSGSAGFIKAGTNTLTLSGTSASNALSGTVTVNAGTLSVSTTSLQDATWDSDSAGTSTIPASAKLGGITGASNRAFTTALTLGGVNTNVSATWTGGFITNNITLTKAGTGTQQLGGSSTGRTSAATTISAGAIQLNSANGLYAAAAAGTTTVSSGGALWLNGGITTPASAGLSLTGTGVTLDGALRSLSGNNTYGATITLAASSTIQSDANTLTLSGLTLGANTLTLKALTGASILLNNVPTASAGSKIIVTGAGTTKAGVANVLTARTNQIDGTFDINGNAQTIVSGNSLDGTGTFTGAVTIADGGALNAGSGAGDATFTLSSTLTFNSGTASSMTLAKGSGTTLSKVAVTGALTLTGSPTVNASATSWTSGTTHTFLTYASKSGAGAFTAGTLTGGTGRQSLGNVVTGATSSTFDVVSGNVAVTWNGGVSGNWYDGQTTGWFGSGVTDFKNGDTVSFTTTSTATATLTSDVTVASLSMANADHVIGGAFTLTNNGSLSVSGNGFTQTINCVATHSGNISISLGANLTVGANALGGTGTLSFVGGNTFTANASVSTSRSVSLPASAPTYIIKNNDSTLTLSGVISNGGDFVAIKGAGILSLQGTNSISGGGVFQLDDSSVAVGKNVLRGDFGTAIPSTIRITMDYGAVCESATNVTWAYGAIAGRIIAGNTAGGGGFSAYSASGISITNGGNTLTFGTSSSTQWNGPMYFGTAYNTALGLTKFTCPMNLNGQSQTFHVFLGSGSTDFGGEISGKVSGTGTFTKAGPGTLTMSNATNDYSATNAVTAGTLKATKKTALGTGAVTMSANAKLQATDTSTSTILSTGSFTSATGARIILGA